MLEAHSAVCHAVKRQDLSAVVCAFATWKPRITVSLENRYADPLRQPWLEKPACTTGVRWASSRVRRFGLVGAPCRPLPGPLPDRPDSSAYAAVSARWAPRCSVGLLRRAWNRELRSRLRPKCSLRRLSVSHAGWYAWYETGKNSGSSISILRSRATLAGSGRAFLALAIILLFAGLRREWSLLRRTIWLQALPCT